MSGSPFLTYAGLLERSTNLVHAYLRDDPDVVGYQFWGHRTINDAYGDPLDSGVGGAGPVAMFRVPRGQSYRSATLRRKKLGLIEENRRGTTHLLFDVEDFVAPAVGGSPIPHDGGWLFLRAQQQRNAGFLQNLGVAEATVTLTAVGAGDELIVKGLIFQFQAGANNLAGRTGAPANEFLVGLGANDNEAAANLTAALNDNGDVSPALDLVAPLGMHTFATNVGAPSNVVLIQPEDATPNLVPGAAGIFTVTTADAPRVALDVATTAAGTLVASLDPTNPVLGPLYCIPPVAHFGGSSSFTLQGMAPSSTGSAAGAPPALNEDLTLAGPRAMHLVFHRPVTELTVRNLSGVNLLVATGPYHLMENVVAGGFWYAGGTQIKDLILACPNGVAGAAFAVEAVSAGESF